MTPIQTHNGLPVVRHGTTKPSPFLVQASPTLNAIVSSCRFACQPPRAVDIGCGNGRQSRFLEQIGFEVLAFDRKPDYGSQIELGIDPLPVFPRSVNVVVLSYVMMFLNPEALHKVVAQAFSCLKWKPSALVVELQDVKSGLIHGEQLVNLLNSIESIAGLMAFETICRRKHHLLVAKL